MKFSISAMENVFTGAINTSFSTADELTTSQKLSPPFRLLSRAIRDILSSIEAMGLFRLGVKV